MGNYYLCAKVVNFYDVTKVFYLFFYISLGSSKVCT